MNTHKRNGRWIGAFLLIAVALCIIPASSAFAGGPTPVGKGVFLIISLDDKFDTPNLSENDKATGSGVILVQIGELTVGDVIFSARYKAASGVTISLPKSVQWKKLSGHAFTVLGSFDAPDASVHLVSPLDTDPNDVAGVPRKVQEAFFAASDGLPEEFYDQFPTTVDIAQFIYDEAMAKGENLPVPPDPEPDLWQPTGEDAPTNLAEWLDFNHADANHPNDPRGGTLTPQMILDNIFRTETDESGDPLLTMDTTTDDTYAEADGDLFPHQPGDSRLFGFDLAIEKKKNNAKVETNMVIDVTVDIKPGNDDNVINNDDDGVVWAAILTTTQVVGKDAKGDDIVKVKFAADTEVDWDTVKLGNSLAKDYKIEDADHDGYDDITLKFDVEDIGLTSTTTEVTLTGKTTATTPMDIIGTDKVSVK